MSLKLYQAKDYFIYTCHTLRHYNTGLLGIYLNETKVKVPDDSYAHLTPTHALLTHSSFVMYPTPDCSSIVVFFVVTFALSPLSLPQNGSFIAILFFIYWVQKWLQHREALGSFTQRYDKKKKKMYRRVDVSIFVYIQIYHYKIREGKNFLCEEHVQRKWGFLQFHLPPLLLGKALLFLVTSGADLRT